MKIGYARTSILNVEADFEAQLRDLKAAGCDKVFTEQVSTVGERAQLAAALDGINDGDTLVVTALDRLARSTADLVRITDGLDAKGAFLQVLDLGVDTGGIDTGTPAGRSMLTTLAAIAQFERQTLLERQREGVAKARAKGRYKGRKPTARAKSKDVLRLKDKGVGATEIAKTLEIGRASVYRIINDRKSGRTHKPERPLTTHSHPLQQEIDAWARRATFASQQTSGYGGHVEKSNDLAAVREFVMQYLDDTGGFPKGGHGVAKLERYGSHRKFRVQFPDD